MLEVSNVVDRQIELCMSEVSDTVLQSLATSAAAKEFGSNTEPEVQWPIGDRIKRAVV